MAEQTTDTHKRTTRWWIGKTERLCYHANVPFMGGLVFVVRAVVESSISTCCNIAFTGPSAPFIMKLSRRPGGVSHARWNLDNTMFAPTHSIV